MARTIPQDKSNGYEEAAERFMSARNPGVGAATVREWSQTVAPRSSILDLGCGHGVPISQVLTEEGFTVYGVDASAKLIAAFRKRFPNAHVECSAVEDSEFFRRRFDGVVAVGLMFLLRTEIQRIVIGKVAKALSPGGKFLFTSPRDAVSWSDALTGRASISLGVEQYERILRAEGLILIGERSDEGDNHYYFVSKPRE
jgi:2-polyprenyl-3-methyl-5-hydroxy-6-metoxy-1,4-benzoquinol methylase